MFEHFIDFFHGFRRTLVLHTSHLFLARTFICPSTTLNVFNSVSKHILTWVTCPRKANKSKNKKIWTEMKKKLRDRSRNWKKLCLRTIADFNTYKEWMRWRKYTKPSDFLNLLFGVFSVRLMNYSHHSHNAQCSFCGRHISQAEKHKMCNSNIQRNCPVENWFGQFRKWHWH